MYGRTVRPKTKTDAENSGKKLNTTPCAAELTHSPRKKGNGRGGGELVHHNTRSAQKRARAQEGLCENMGGGQGMKETSTKRSRTSEIRKE